MRDFRDAKAMAASLRQALADRSVTLTHSDSLELIAKSFGLDNWNILAAKIEAERRPSPEPQSTPEPAVASGGSKTLYCSFCGKSQHDVEALIAGPECFICNECVDLCDGIMLDRDVQKRLEAGRTNHPDADPLEVARDAFRSLSDERLARSRKSLGDMLDHWEWGVRQTTAALERAPGVAWEPDERAREKGQTRDPLAGRSRDQIAKQKGELERRVVIVRANTALLDHVLRERGVDLPQDPNVSA
jgi:hypothetical protein